MVTSTTFRKPLRHALLVALALVLTARYAPPATAQAGPDVCYLVADRGGSNGGDDLLTWVNRTTGVETVVGSTGTTYLEDGAYWPGTNTLYSADDRQIGTIDYTGTGLVTPLPNPLGIGSGDMGNLSLSDMDALAFDPFTGTLYGANRWANDNDVLAIVNTTTGSHVPNAFGTDVDYVTIHAEAVVGLRDVDGIAIDPYDGQLYAVVNNGGVGGYLVKVDKTNGTVTAVGPLNQDDIEGLDFSADGALYGTTGSDPLVNRNSFFRIDKTTGNATLIGPLGAGGGVDYETVACLTDGVNTITGKVYYDVYDNNTFGAPDTGTPNITVQLYRDVNGDNLVDAGDLLLATTTTDADGDYAFTVAATGDFVLQIVTGGLPAQATMNTDNVEEASFTGFGGTDGGNDFSYTLPIDLELTKTVDEAAPDSGAQVVFTLTLLNKGPGTATNVRVGDVLPNELAYLSDNPSQGSYNVNDGRWDVGEVAANASYTLEITVKVNTAEPVTNVAQVTQADQADTDSTPNNDDGDQSEDDEDNVTITPSGSSCGCDGGVESEGTLAQTLAQVLYTRGLDRAAAQEAGGPPPVPVFDESHSTLAKGSSALNDLLKLVPTNGPQQSQAHEVSPTDLLPVTNATGVFAVDYVRTDGRRLGALFATTTKGEIYEHTKVVCDRLRGATLEAIRHIDVAGHPFILSELRQANGTYDYTISLVIYPEGDRFVVDSRFRLDEYDHMPEGVDVFNLQLWSVSKGYTVDLAERVLTALNTLGPVAFRNTADTPPEIPGTFVRAGRYHQGSLVVELYNATRSRTLILSGGTLARTESGQREFFDLQVPMPAPQADRPPIVEVEIPVGPVFDAAFFVETKEDRRKDQLYLADGAWGYNTDPEGATVDRFDVAPQPDLSSAAPGKWVVERPVSIEGEVQTSVSVFRYLQSNGLPLNLDGYQYIEFMASGEGQVRLLTEKASITTSDHYGTVFKLSPRARQVRIWFDDLRRADGQGGFTAEDLTLLSFHIIGPQGQRQPYAMHLEALRFGGGEGDQLAELPDAYELKQNYPNPFNPRTTIEFGVPEAGPGRLVVYDLLGRQVAVLADGFLEAGRHAVPFVADDLASGVYLYRLETPSRTISRAMVLMR